MSVIPALLSTLIKTLLYDEVNAESAFVDSLELIPNQHTISTLAKERWVINSHIMDNRSCNFGPCYCSQYC